MSRKQAEPPDPAESVAASQAHVEVVSMDSLTPDAANVRRRDERAKKSLAASLRQFGPARSIVLDGKGIVRAGNGTLEAAQEAGVSEVLVVKPAPGQLVAVQRDDWSATEATAYGVADNRLGELSEFDPDALSKTLDALRSDDFDLDAIGFTADEIDGLLEGVADDILGDEALGDDSGGGTGESAPPSEPAARPTLAERFIIPPFSVLDARQGYWQERKRKWLAIGIQSELGRGGTPEPVGAGGGLPDGERAIRQNNGGGIAPPADVGPTPPGSARRKSTFNDREWIKAKGLSGLAQDAHVKNHAQT